ncbi:glycosyltransferase [Phycisphaerales bacterium AB-hyl4]|uniref:Glycosyltransferase n=1 Tax=Natronomicrosphaera hydrolytica TaxID=3242702 RepID=A0ABV4U5R6_9BACT
MIFVTVGTQLPFDRLVEAVDQWAAERQRDDVLAQVGESAYPAKAIRTVASLPPAEFQATFASASLVVAHAGLGTILSAMELGKPILVMPRRAAMNEHRNDHQLATAERFADRQGVTIAKDESEIAAHLDAVESLEAGERVEATASPMLINAIRTFIAGNQPGPEPTAAVPVR